MTDPLPKPRSRWKRWAALALVLAIGCGVWLASGENEAFRKSQHLRVGMTQADVRAIMGKAYQCQFAKNGQIQTMVFVSPTELWMANRKVDFRHWLRQLGRPARWLVILDGVEVKFLNHRLVSNSWGKSVVVGR